jgi:hypothetical protein
MLGTKHVAIDMSCSNYKPHFHVLSIQSQVITYVLHNFFLSNPYLIS